MDFLPTDDSHITTIIGGGFFLALLFSPLLIIGSLSKNKVKKRRYLLSYGVLILILFISGGIYAGLNKDTAADNFHANMSQKYDYDSIETIVEDYPPRGQRANEVENVFFASRFVPQKIALTVDGKTEEFVVIQDTETNEPTLYDLPENIDDIGEQEAIYPYSYRAETLLKNPLDDDNNQ